MKVTAGNNWQANASSTLYHRTALLEESGFNEDEEISKEVPTEADTDTLSASLEAIKRQTEDNSDGGLKMKSSKPDDSIGQLAAELTRAETRIDVQQVSSKATRALINLKMSYAACDEGDRKKISQMIKRMEKLIKRINKKLQHLNKEEQLEGRRKQAEKKMDMRRESLLRNELRTRRNKRRRDERDYAMKELAQDGKNSSQEMISGMVGSGSTQGLFSSPELATFGDIGGMDVGASMADFGGVDMVV